MDNYTMIPLADNVDEMFIGPFGSSLKNDCFVEKENGYCMVYEQKHAIQKTMDVETRYVSEEKYNELKRFNVRGGDIIVSCRGTIGETFVVPDDAPLGIMHPSIMKIRLKEDVYDKSYFNLLLREHLKKHDTTANGSGVKMAISAKELGSELFPVPPMDEQRKISKTISEISEIIAARQQQLQKLDELVKARFVELLGDGNHPHIALIDLIIEGAGLSYGIVQPGDDGTGDIGVLRPVDMVDGKISTASIKRIDRSIGDGFKKTELYGDELLITVRGTTGITALTDIRFNGMNVTRGIAVVRYDRNKINPVYLNAYLNTDESQRYIQEHTRGATLQQINLSDLRVQQIMVPPLALQEQMAAFVEQTDKSKAVIQKALDEAQLLFDSLMQKYFG